MTGLWGPLWHVDAHALQVRGASTSAPSPRPCAVLCIHFPSAHAFPLSFYMGIDSTFLFCPLLTLLHTSLWRKLTCTCWLTVGRSSVYVVAKLFRSLSGGLPVVCKVRNTIQPCSCVHSVPHTSAPQCSSRDTAASLPHRVGTFLRIPLDCGWGQGCHSLHFVTWELLTWDLC